MLKKVFIFITALALVIISMSVFELIVPWALGIDSASIEMRQNPEVYKSFMQRQPSSLYIGMMLTNFIGAVIGGMTLGFGDLPKWSVFILGGACMAIGFALKIPGSPSWFPMLDLLVYVPGILLGYEWVHRSRKLVTERATKG